MRKTYFKINFLQFPKLHRRAFWDDGFGVEEALDEPGEDGRGLIVRARHWLLLDTFSSAEHRPLALEMFRTGTPHMMAFAQFDGKLADYTHKFRTEFSALSLPISSKIHIMTLRPLDADHVLLRLEHFYQGNENVNSAPVEVDIQKLFTPFTVLSGEELNLAANRPVKQFGSGQGHGSLLVQLQPMEIRTFRLRISH
uniref:Glyco_hydro38C2 domain-containing protein n=1 Tax=Globodera pallida TaxID=36090 RepID=A0A183CLS7_GLOPA